MEFFTAQEDGFSSVGPISWIDANRLFGTRENIQTTVAVNSKRRHMTGKHIPFVAGDLTADDEAMAMVSSFDYRQVPIVVVGDRHRAGYMLSTIDAITEAEMAGAAPAEIEPSF